MKISIYQIDAFTSELFGGNPAAVCPLDEWLADDIMQKIATENNLSETAFFVQKDDGFELRWFTPEMEVDLCGHATLASAHVLFHYLNYDKETIKFFSKSGELSVKKDNDLLALDFPSRDCHSIEPPEVLSASLNIQPVEVYDSGQNLMAVYDSEEDILALRPNFLKLKEMEGKGLIATAKGNSCDFVSRFFAPSAGIDEDPVTGSAHCTLTPYWSKTLDKKSLHAKQISKRGGELFCEDALERTIIKGKAVTYLIGQIEI